MFKIGDYVKPKPEWTVPPFNVVPSGRIDAFEMNGIAAYVGGRAFGTYVFDLDENPTEQPPAIEPPVKTPAQQELQLSREEK